MEENQSSNQVGCSSCPDVSSPENQLETLRQDMSHLGIIIPNRIFVGGIDHKMKEKDLHLACAQHGTIKDVKIVFDRSSGASKGYGFVTYEAADDAQKLLNSATEICVREKRISIGPAFRRQSASGHTASMAQPPKSSGGRHQTSSTGYSYMYHNGMAYFQCPAISPPHQHWPRFDTPLMPPQYTTVYQPPSYPQYQRVPDRYPWNAVQPLLPSGPVVFPPPSEYLYPPADGGSVPPPQPVTEDTLPENRMFPQSQVHLRPTNH